LALSKEQQAVYFKMYYEAHKCELLAWQHVYQAKQREEFLAHVKASREEHEEEAFERHNQAPF
jgi:hypothetical protein